MPEFTTLLTSELPALAGDVETPRTFPDGTACPAPATIHNRFKKWSPAEIDDRAKPYDTAPSATVMTATTDAINALGLEACPQIFDGGTYWIDGTISPTGKSSDQALAPKDVEYNNTMFRVDSSIPESNFDECTDQATGTNGLAGLDDTTDNLPAGETTRVIFDVYNTERSCFKGLVHIDGGNLDLAAFAAANSQGTDAIGGLACVWDTIRITKCRWGLFGTPLYNQARNFLASAFVGWFIKRLRMEPSIPFPMLIGGNQGDGLSIGVFNPIFAAAARAYLYNIEIICQAIYTSGNSTNDYAFDLKRGHLIFGSFYAEGNFAAPIYARSGSWVEGTCKYGAGGTTVFGKKTFIYNDDVSGGGEITMHNRSGEGTDIQSAVLLRARTNSKRNYWVKAPYLEADGGSGHQPFKMEAGTGTLSTADKLVSFYRDGLAKWTPTGTSAAPSLSRTLVI